MSMSARLPRGVRVPALLLVVLLGLSAAGWGLFVHNPAPATSDRPAFLSAPGEPLPAPAENKSYRITIKYRSTDPGQPAKVVRQKKYVPGHQPVVKDSQIAPGGDVVQYVVYRSGQQRFIRKTFDDPSSLQRRVDADGVVRVERSTLTAYRARAASTSPATIEPRRALQQLYLFRYDKRGKTTFEGETVVKYVPVTGWATRQLPDGGERTLYVREASGVVLVDPETGAIRKAKVKGSIVKADSWGEVMTGNAVSVVIEYRVETGVDEVSQPPWVGTLNGTSGGQPGER